MRRFGFALIAIFGMSHGTFAQEARDGWITMDSPHSYSTLVSRTRDAVKTADINLVTQASASDGARGAGFDIPGNRVLGLFRNDYARRMLAASIPAGIEAPIRMYVTETDDGQGRLSWKTPSAVFAPYIDSAAPDLEILATELDLIFEGIAATATRP